MAVRSGRFAIPLLGRRDQSRQCSPMVSLAAFQYAASVDADGTVVRGSRVTADSRSKPTVECRRYGGERGAFAARVLTGLSPSSRTCAQEAVRHDGEAR